MNDDFIDIIPFSNKNKCMLEVPGSKSISNRALILAVLNDGVVKLNGILQSEDVDIMLDALKLLGVKIEIERDWKEFRDSMAIERKFDKIGNICETRKIVNRT